MFDKMKQLMELQKQAKEIQKKLESTKVDYTEDQTKIVVNGLFKVESLEINPSLLSPEKKGQLESLLCRIFSKAVQEAQKRSAEQSKELLKGLPF